MKNIHKTICDFTKSDLEKYEQELRKIFKDPKYFCKKCLRSSAKKEFLCKPEKI